MEKIKGKCHCGACHYTLDSKKQFEFLCHCTDCRVINSGGHLSGIIFDETGLTVKGPLSTYAYTGGSGKAIEYKFCQNCGTGVYAKPLAHEKMVVIRANTLTDNCVFKPSTSLFPESAHSWDGSVIK